MNLEDLWALLIVAGFLAGVFYFVRLCIALERAFVWRSLGLLAGYFVYCGVGVALVWWLAAPPAPEDEAVAATLLALAWIGYGGVWLARLAPRGDARPAISRRLGWLDAAFALAAALSAAYLLVA